MSKLAIAVALIAVLGAGIVAGFVLPGIIDPGDPEDPANPNPPNPNPPNPNPPNPDPDYPTTGQMAILYTENMSVQEKAELIYAVGTPTGYTYVYRIASIHNYPVTPLGMVMQAPSNGSFTITAGTSNATSSSISNSVAHAFSSTTESSTSTNFDGKVNLFGGEFGGSHNRSWSESSTTTNEYATSIGNSVTSESNWSVSYTVVEPTPGYYYRVAYVTERCDVYQYIHVDIETGEKTLDYGVFYDDNMFIQLQYSVNGSFDIPEKMKVEAEYSGPLDTSRFGTESNPYTLLTIKDVQLISSTNNYYYVLGADIDMSSVYWRPHAFMGTLDGQGNSLIGLKILHDDYSEVISMGLFTNNQGTIKNLIMEDSKIEIYPNNVGKKTSVVAGGIVAVNNGTIENCTVKGMEMHAHSSDIWKLGKESGKTNKQWSNMAEKWPMGKAMSVYAGGVAGKNAGTIKGCDTVDSLIDATCVNFDYDNDVKNLYNRAGGIVAYNSGTVKDCESNSEIKGHIDLRDWDNAGYLADYKPKATGYMGGIAGQSTVSISGCTFDGKLTDTKYANAPDFWGGSKGSTSKIKWSVGDICGIVSA